MTRGAALCALLSVCLLSCQLDLEPEEEEDDIGSLSEAATRPGYWNCSRIWNAWTTYRKMVGPTTFECGPGNCGDASHSQPKTWVDIVGGISQSCEDHSSSFYGPYSGEWSGCSAFDQTATGLQAIAGVNQSWDRWPGTWRNGRYDQCSLASLVTTDYVRGAFASVYDLDYCTFKQFIGTVNWPDFPVTARITAGGTSPTSCTSTSGTGSLRLFVDGNTGSTCGPDQGSCNSSVCADLRVATEVSCNWTPPQTCNAAGASCSAYNNTNDSSCCSYYCYNFHCR